MTAATQFRVFTFDTTHHAMWAEDVAREQSLPVEVVPAPADGQARCGAALRVADAQRQELEAALQGEGIPHRILSITSGS